MAFVPSSLFRCLSGLERMAEYVVTLMMLHRGQMVRALKKQVYSLVVVRDVTSHGGETEVGCAGQADVADREALYPVIPSPVLGLDLKA